jgi:hypothetical protein
MLKNGNNELFNDNDKDYVNTQLNRGNNHTIDTNNFGTPFNSYDNLNITPFNSYDTNFFTNVQDSVQPQIIFTPFDSDNSLFTSVQDPVQPQIIITPFDSDNSFDITPFDSDNSFDITPFDSDNSFDITPFDSDNNFENQLNTSTQEKDIKSFISISSPRTINSPKSMSSPKSISSPRPPKESPRPPKESPRSPKPDNVSENESSLSTQTDNTLVLKEKKEIDTDNQFLVQNEKASKYLNIEKSDAFDKDSKPSNSEELEEFSKEAIFTAAHSFGSSINSVIKVSLLEKLGIDYNHEFKELESVENNLSHSNMDEIMQSRMDKFTDYDMQDMEIKKNNETITKEIEEQNTKIKSFSSWPSLKKYGLGLTILLIAGGLSCGIFNIPIPTLPSSVPTPTNLPDGLESPTIAAGLEIIMRAIKKSIIDLLKE